MKKAIKGVVLGAVLFAGATAPALAGPPANRACLGIDVSGYAQVLHPWGETARVLAEGGAGTEVQMHLAGQIPGNTCSE